MARISLKAPFYISRPGSVIRTRFKHQEVKLLFLLMFHRKVTKKMAMEALWPNPDLMPDCWNATMMVYIHYVREKLKPHGWRVVNRYTQGWQLVERGENHG